jgi:AcrR family transcriptional regulator
MKGTNNIMNKQSYFYKLINEESSTKQKLFYSAILLFSQKGYSNVGMRELCRSVNVKESAFYNHYSSKEDLFKIILDYFQKKSSEVVYTGEEIASAIAAGNIRMFLEQNMQKFSNAAGGLLYHTILQIMLMESYVHPEAKEIARQNLYYIRKNYTEKVLNGMMEKGFIKKCNVKTVTAEYYYALKGLLEEYLLMETWGEDLEPINEKISEHIDFFVELLRK